jgi:hypothetical protein
MGDVKTKEAESGADQPLPERCTKAAFARLLAVDAANVSRWISSGRIVVDQQGAVAVFDSLARLIATADPARGGRGGQGASDANSSLNRAQHLLTHAARQPRQPARLGELQAKVKELEAQLAAERAWHAQWSMSREEMSRRMVKFHEDLNTVLLRMAPGIDLVDFEREFDRLDGRHFYDMTDAELDEQEALDA